MTVLDFLKQKELLRLLRPKAQVPPDAGSRPALNPASYNQREQMARAFNALNQRVRSTNG